MVSPNQNNARIPSSSGSLAKNPPSPKGSHSRHRQHRLLWAFSRAETAAEKGYGGGGDSTAATAPNPRGGVVTLEDGDGGGGTVKFSSPVKRRGLGGKFGPLKENCAPVQQPPIQQRLHTKPVDGKEELLCAAQAICECGRRAGGGAGSGKGEVGGEGSQVKLPLAVLKVWGRDSDEERRRKSRPPARGQLGTPCRGRRLRVVSQPNSF